MIRIHRLNRPQRAFAFLGSSIHIRHNSTSNGKHSRNYRFLAQAQNEVTKQSTEGRDLQIIKTLGQYIWPKNDIATKTRVIGALSLLLAGKVLAAQVLDDILSAEQKKADDNEKRVSPPSGPEHTSPVLLQANSRLSHRHTTGSNAHDCLRVHASWMSTLR